MGPGLLVRPAEGRRLTALSRLPPGSRTPLTALGVALVTGAAAVAIMLPAPLPGHVVSSNDIARRVTPFAHRPPIDPERPRNFQLTDPVEVFRPDLYWARQQVRAGHLPTWSPLLFGGWPLLASQQAAPLFPISGLSYALPYEASIAWRIVALLMLAAVGAFLFARAIGLGRLPAALAGVAYGLSGPLVLWSMHPHDDVHAMLGWMMLGADGAVRGRRWGVPVLAAAIGLALLGGHPQSVFIDGMLVAAWGIVTLVGLPRGERLSGAARLVGGGALGLLAAAIVLAPFLELLGQTAVHERGGTVGAGPEALFTLALPDLWGRPDWAWSVDPAGLTNYLERTAFVGAMPFLVACIGLAIGRDRVRWFFAAAAGVLVVLAYDLPGISDWLVDLWPLRLAMMSRAIVPLAFCLAMLGGFGLQAIIERPWMLRRPAALAFAGVVLVVPVAYAAARYDAFGGLDGAFGFLPGATRPASGEQAAAATALRWSLEVGIGIALLALFYLKRRPVVPVAAAAVLLTACGLAIGWHGYLPVMPTDEAKLRPTQSVLALRSQQGSGRAVAGATRAGPQLLVPNTGEYFGLRDPRGRGVPTLERNDRVWATLGGAVNDHHAFVNPSNPASARLLRLFAVRAALVLPGGTAPWQSRLIHRGRDGDVYAIRGTLPRAFVTCRWRPASESTAAAMLARETAEELRERPFVEGVGPPDGDCASGAGAARFVSESPTEVTIEARGKSPGRLVLLDSWYPGWSATVDGRSVSIAATDVAFRSVPVPAGTHRVVFSYRPASVRAGAIVSAVAWLAILALGLLAGRRRWPFRRAPRSLPQASRQPPDA